MAKKADKPGKSGTKKAGKASKAEQPKTAFPAEIAGVKVPKRLRKAGAQVRDLAQDPIVADVVAAALLAAAAKLANTKSARKLGSEGADAAEGATDEAVKAGSAIKDTLIGLARTAIDAFESKPRKG